MAAPSLLALILLAAPGADVAPLLPPAPPAAASAPAHPTPTPTDDPSDDISLEEWKRDDWMLVRPKVALFDIGGYLRFRGDLLRRLDFDNGAGTELDASGKLVPRYPASSDGHAEVNQLSMRLRVEPRININEQAQIMATVDVLDNLVFGSTPDSLAAGGAAAPINLFSLRQLPPRRYDNALMDSVAVKRLWARVTALNEQLEVRIGRMPNHFGLGMLYNSGDCLDCNWGNVVDRVAIGFKLFNHVFAPSVDWISSGPQQRPFGVNDPEPLGAVTYADTVQYGLRIEREDHPDDVRDATLHGRRVFNYGTSQMFRLQARDIGDNAYNAAGFTPQVPPSPDAQAQRRDAFVYIGDAYGKFYVGTLQLGLEAAVQAGSFRDTLYDPAAAPQLTTILMLGAALDARYHLRPDGHGLQLGLKAGGASGDSHAGFGALDRARTQRGGSDHALRNFQFSPDYHVDLLMFRRVIGTVTDAWYVRPEIAYRFDDRVIGRLDAVYSQAMQAASTPSAQGPDRADPLGIELDAEVFYGADTASERGQFMASVAGGLLFPLAGMRNPQVPARNQAGSFAWTTQARVYLTF